MNFYRLILIYNGFNYHGWQFQTAQEKTLQEVFEFYLKKVLNDPEARSIAASRTDSKVHAQGQVLKILTSTDLECGLLKERLNFNLPPAIKVKSCLLSDESFNPNRDTKSKEYHYLFSESETENPILNQSVFYIKKELNIEAMKKACDFLLGVHDFKHFHVPGSRTPYTIREIFECSIDSGNFLNEKSPYYTFKIKGNGFLKYMVRILMHFVFQIGLNEISLQDFKSYFEVKPEIQKAPAHGLHLITINY